jgi:hypothetical protein
MTTSGETFNNLIDICIKLEEEGIVKPDELFSKLLQEYFFKKEAEGGKNLEAMIGEIKVAEFTKQMNSLLELNPDELDVFVNGEGTNDSLSGKIMLSPQYLKVFYKNHPPTFGKLPESVQFELFEKIKSKNESIVSSFRKIKEDIDSDKRRTILKLVALAVKNVSRRTGRPFSNVTEPVDQIIRNNYPGSDEIFTATNKQIAILKDESRIKSIIKAFFTIRQFKEITEITELLKSEIERYIKRGKKATSL